MRDSFAKCCYLDAWKEEAVNCPESARAVGQLPWRKAKHGMLRIDVAESRRFGFELSTVYSPPSNAVCTQRGQRRQPNCQPARHLFASLLLVNADQITARASGSELNHTKCILWMQYLCQKSGTIAIFSFACAAPGDYIQCVVDLR